MNKKTKRMNKKQAVYESLRYNIIHNDFRPGEVLNEKILMAQYKIGRTPLREILLELKHDKLVTMIPRVGTLVTTMELTDLKEIIEVRKTLETLVARLATKYIESAQIDRIKKLVKKVKKLKKNRPADTIEKLTQYDLEFHHILYDATRNQRLKEILLEQQHLMARFWFHLDIAEEDFFSQMIRLDLVIKGLEKKDAAMVQQALEDHIHLYIAKVKEEIL